MFMVAESLIKKSATLKNLIDDVGIENAIPLQCFTAKTFEHFLMTLTNNALPPKLTLNDLSKLLGAHNYLDVKTYLDHLFLEILKKLSWKKESLTAVLNNKYIDPRHKRALIDIFIKQRIDHYDITLKFFSYKGLALKYKLLIMEAIIRRSDFLLKQIVPEENILIKECKALGINPLSRARSFSDPNDDEKAVFQEIKELVGDNFTYIEQNILKDYQTNDIEE